MSEYQYYEFLAVDRALSITEMKRLRAISSRAEITPFGFVNEYNWGDLKADPRDLMRNFFDAHVYLANWGDAVFMLRLPKEAIDQKMLDVFCVSSCLEYEQSSQHYLLRWSLGATDDSVYFDDISRNWMLRLAPLRIELLCGDMRSLYIGWLRGVQREDMDPDILEPMVLQGLGQLTAAQQALAEFLGIDVDVLTGVGEGSPDIPSETADEVRLDRWLNELPKSEVIGYLRQMLTESSMSAVSALKRRYAVWLAQFAPTAEMGCRSIAQLMRQTEQARALRIAQDAQDRLQADAERKRQRDVWLAQLYADLPKAWKSAHDEVGYGTARGYDAACQHLLDLRDAYNNHANLSVYQIELQKFMTGYLRRPALVKRLVKEGLWRA